MNYEGGHFHENMDIAMITPSKKKKTLYPGGITSRRLFSQHVSPNRGINPYGANFANFKRQHQGPLSLFEN